MRTVADMIDGRNAPVHSSGGKPLIDLQAKECRFPTGRANGQHLFCAAKVSGWAPGQQHGCYCQQHRAYLRGLPSVWEERGAA